MDSTPRTTDERDRATERRLRLRVLLRKHRTILLVGFVLALALGAWVSYGAYAAPNETTERRLANSWSATGEFSHGATVAESTPIHDAGTELEDEPLYYTAVTPTVDGEFVAGYEDGAGSDVRVRVTVDLAYRAVDPEDDTVYWEERTELATVVEEDVEPGDPVAAAFAVNVSEVAASIDEIETELGAGPGETEIELEIEREIDGSIEGEDWTVSDRYDVPIEYRGGTYEIDEEEAEGYDEPYGTYETETVAVAASPVRRVGGPLLAIVGAGGVAGLAAAGRRWPAPTATEREWLAYRGDRAQFDEVITTVRLPEERLDGPRAELDSLAALAEFGIDVGAAILHEPRAGLYVVRHDGLLYAFEPPTLGSNAGGGDSAEERLTYSDDPIDGLDDDLVSLAGVESALDRDPEFDRDPDADGDGREDRFEP